MTEDTFLTIEAPSEGIYKEKGSKFLAFAYPVHSPDEVKQWVDVAKKNFFDARHHCYAYILGADKSQWRTNDDGEPSGTAGKPIHGQLLSNDLTDTLIIVVRYFGGVKLGVSGLINAYRTAAADAISNAHIVEKTVDVHFKILFDYVRMNDVMRLTKLFDIQPLNLSYDNSCCFDFFVRKSLSDRVVNQFSTLHDIDLSLIN